MSELPEQPHWLEVPPSYFEAMRSSLRKAFIAMGLASAILAGWLFHSFREPILENPTLAAQVVALLLLPLVGIAIGLQMGRLAQRMAHATRLGAARGGLHYELPALQARVWSMPARGKVPWDAVSFDGRRLRIGRARLLVYPPFGRAPLFAPAEFDRWIVARVAPGRASL